MAADGLDPLKDPEAYTVTPDGRIVPWTPPPIPAEEPRRGVQRPSGTIGKPAMAPRYPNPELGAYARPRREPPPPPRPFTEGVGRMADLAREAAAEDRGLDLPPLIREGMTP